MYTHSNDKKEKTAVACRNASAVFLGVARSVSGFSTTLSSLKCRMAYKDGRGRRRRGHR